MNQPISSVVESRGNLRNSTLTTIELLLVLAVVACTCEGMLRKWVIPSESPLRFLAYFSKDILFTACLFFPYSQKDNWLAFQFKQWLVPGLILTLFGCAIGAISEINMVGAILTIRSTVVLPVIAMLVCTRVRPQVVYCTIVVLGFLAIGNALLSGVQFFSPADSVINKYATEGQHVATAGYSERIRATGTFSYITGFGVFSSLAMAIGLTLYATAQRFRRPLFFSYLVIAASLFCSGTTVSRGVMLTTLATLVIWVGLSRQSVKLVFSFAVAGVMLFFVFEQIGILSETTEILSATQKRHEAVNDPIFDRLTGPILEIPKAITIAPIGNGLGTEQVGGNYAAQGEMGFTTFESEFPRIIMEIGLVGFVGVSITYFGAVYTLFLGWRNANDQNTKNTLLAILLVCVAWIYGGVVFNHISSFYFWSMLTVAFALMSKPISIYRED